MKKLYFLLGTIIMAGLAVQAQPRKAGPRKAASTIATPVALPATDITANGFTANWKAVPAASVYQVTVYEPLTVTESGRYTVLEEDFNLIGIGSFQEPAYLEDFYIDMAEYDMVKTPDWSVMLPVFAKGMVAGMVYSPYIDLTGDGGKYTIRMGFTGYSGGQVEVTSVGNGIEQTKMLTLTTTGYNTFEVDFTNGAHDTFVTITDYGIPNDTEGLYADCFDFLDDIEFIQNLKAGDTYLRLVQVAETSEDEPVTSWPFYEMPFRNGADRLAYDVMAIEVVYTDPDDLYEYDVIYSDYSELQHVNLNAGIADIEADTAAGARYFNLQGIAVEGDLAPGIYIRRQGSEATKVLIK